MPFYPFGAIAEEVPPDSTSSPQAESPPEEITIPAPPAEETPLETGQVVTGDATAETEIVNEVNVNVVKIETSPLPEETTTPAPPSEGGEEAVENFESPESTPSLDVSIENEAVVENESETAAETGENSALNIAGEAEIATGDAMASTNVVSVVNLNLIESNGFLYLLNNFLNYLGHVDLRPLASSETSSEDPCGPPDCDALGTTLEAEIKNNALISNVLITRSGTGTNSAGAAGLASILTGDAYAGANLVNLANTNIIDSNYLLFAFNNFGDWDGDLIFPNSDFFSSFFSGSGSSSGEVANNNFADIESEVEVSAETGANAVEGGEEGLIETGSAFAGANVSNFVNTNLFNTSNLYVVFRIFGSWDGTVFNAPEGITWAETQGGIELFSENEEGNQENSEGGGEIDVTTDNRAAITNKVKVFALTGENKVGGGGVGSITTGDAFAGANVLNIANTNVVSSNWVIALINIFGDWGGNVSFGQPDIWVATQAEGPEVLGPGSEVTFHTTVANRGDARASNVQFSGNFNSPLINFEGQEPGQAYSLGLESLVPGETKEFSYSARVNDAIPRGQTLIDHTLEISANETDASLEDNSDIVSLLIFRSSSRRSRHAPTTLYITTNPILSVVKENSAREVITVPGSVDYEIVVENSGGSAFAGVLRDVLKDESGNIVSENSWELGEIFSDEEITITYTAIFNENTASGTYTNSAWVEAWGGNYLQNPALGTKADSNIATSLITILNDEAEVEGEVLGESCGLYLDKFMRRGENNDIEQVKKLQVFLNKEMGADLPVTGFYGELTLELVKDFQEKYAEEILSPWNLEKPTGIVYQTTLRWINKLECPDLSLEIPPLTNWASRALPALLAKANSGSAPIPTPPEVKLDNEEADRPTSSVAKFFNLFKDIFR
ncbi:MAG: hypothetical protein AAB500_02475 [Patescibacteria group bacterium]